MCENVKQIPIHKTKSKIIAKDPIRSKLPLDSEPIEQVMSFTYLQ